MTEIGSNESLSISVDDAGVIIARGDIDLAGGPLLEQAIHGLDVAGPVVVDLEGVSFIDSSGLRSLLGASRRAAEQSSSIVLRSPSSEVRRLLEITGTSSQFTVEGDAQ